MPTKKLPSYKKYSLLLIAAFFILRCIVAFSLDLGNDESYYWLYSQHLQWNYFDHPPIVALWARLFTANLLLQDYEFFLRLGSLVGCAIASWFLFKTLANLHSERAGFFAVALYNASFYAGITAGLYLMPDAPQMVFWTFCMWMIAKITTDEDRTIPWLLFGMGVGLCIMSKVHGIFIPFGFGLYVLFKKRDWLKKWQLYAAYLLMLIIISPILIWNIEYDFATYSFHSKRVTVDQSAIKIYSFLEEILSQFSFNNPFNVTLIVLGLIAWHTRKMQRISALSIYQFIGIPLAIILLSVSLFRDTVLIHWSGPGYVSLLPIAAVFLTDKMKSIFPALLKGSLITFVFVIISWMMFVNFYPGTPGKKDEKELGFGDISLDLYGWKEAGKQFSVIYKNDVAKGIVAKGTPLVGGYWWAAHADYYFAHPYNIKMIGLGEMNQIRHYLWMNYLRQEEVNMNSAYCIMPSDENYDIPTSFYNKVEKVKVIEIKRAGKPAHNFVVYRLSGWKGTMPVSL